MLGAGVVEPAAEVLGVFAGVPKLKVGVDEAPPPPPNSGAVLLLPENKFPVDCGLAGPLAGVPPTRLPCDGVAVLLLPKIFPPGAGLPPPPPKILPVGFDPPPDPKRPPCPAPADPNRPPVPVPDDILLGL